MAFNKRVTIKEIAEEAGVSTQTVSRVINKRHDVSPATRQRIQSIIDKNGYQPNLLARSLSSGRTYTIGVVSSGLYHVGPSQTLNGIYAAARDLGYTLALNIVPRRDDLDMDAILNHMQQQHVDGVIWAAVEKMGKDKELLRERLPDLPVPVTANMEPAPGVTVVNTDNVTGAKLATLHLSENGYQTIGIITGQLDEWSANQRLSGWRESLHFSGLDNDETLVVSSDWTAIGGYEAFRRLRRQRPDIDAVFVSNDQMALGVLKAAQELGIQIPHELGVVGFDDIPESEFFSPSLTTIRQDLIGNGRLLMQELDRAIRANQSGTPVASRTIISSPQLIVRASSVPLDGTWQGRRDILERSIS